MKPKYQEIVDNRMNLSCLGARRGGKNYCEENDSCIKDIFCGQLRSYVTQKVANIDHLHMTRFGTYQCQK